MADQFDFDRLDESVRDVLAPFDVEIRSFSDDGRIAVVLVDCELEEASEALRARWGDRVRMRVGSVEWEPQ